MRLFIGQLPADVTRAELLAIFSQWGSVVDVYLPDNSAACAFIEFADPADAEQVILDLNGMEWGGKHLVVEHARARKFER